MTAELVEPVALSYAPCIAASTQRRGNLGDMPALKVRGVQFIVTRLALAISGERRCSVR